MSETERGGHAWLESITNMNFTRRLVHQMAKQSDYIAVPVPRELQAERNSCKMYTHEQLVIDTTKVPCRLPTNN